MSRIGRAPITIPAGVEVTVDGSTRSAGPSPEYPVNVASPFATVKDHAPSACASARKQRPSAIETIAQNFFILPPLYHNFLW